MILKHHCEECSSQYSIEFSEDDTEDNPIYCPFCGEYVTVESLEKDV